MTMEEIIKKCDQQMSIVGENASVGLLIPGRWGKANTRRLWEGGPVGKIVMELEGLVYVIFSAKEVKEAVQKILDESTVYGNDCQGGRCEL
jgi:hypothetical protein